MKFIYTFSIFIILSILTYSLCYKSNLKNTNLLSIEKSLDNAQEYQEYFWVQTIDSTKDALNFLLKTHRFFQRKLVIVSAESIAFTHNVNTKTNIESINFN